MALPGPKVIEALQVFDYALNIPCYRIRLSAFKDVEVNFRQIVIRVIEKLAHGQESRSGRGTLRY